MEEIIKEIEAKGYCVIPQVYTKEQVKKSLDLVLQWRKRTEGSITKDLPHLATDPIVWNLHCKDFYFLKMLFASSDIERVLSYFLNDAWYKKIPSEEPNYIMRGYIARSSVSRLPLHIDSFIPYKGKLSILINFFIILEDMTQDNGSTIVVPGSHSSGQYANQTAVKDSIPIEAKAGDVLIFDGRLWHGALANKTNSTRWVMVATFSRWWVKQSFNITQRLPQEFYEKLTSKQKSILGFCSIPFNDETEGVDLRQGYDALINDLTGHGFQKHSKSSSVE